MPFEILAEDGGVLLAEDGSAIQYEHDGGGVPVVRRYAAPFAARRVVDRSSPASRSPAPDRARFRSPG